jgi:hypothetical protein
MQQQQAAQQTANARPTPADMGTTTTTTKET